MKTSKKKVHNRVNNTYRYCKGCYDNDKLISLIIEHCQMISYYTIYKNNDGKAMSSVYDDELLKIYREILKDVSIKIGKELNSDSTKSNDNMHIRAKIVLFHGDKRPKLGKRHKCLTLIRLEFICVTSETRYYPQVFLEELKINNTRNACIGCNTFN